MEITRKTAIDLVYLFIFSFIGIAGIAFLEQSGFAKEAQLMLIGSFGATAVLLYAAPASPLAQNKNLFLGHGLSAIIGVTVAKCIPVEYAWLSHSLSVSLSIVCMQALGCLHPPGGATALIASMGGETIKNLGYMYVLSPVLLGVSYMWLVAKIYAWFKGNHAKPNAK